MTRGEHQLASLTVTLLLFMAIDATWFPGRLQNAGAARPGVVHAPESFAHGARSYLIVSTVSVLVVAIVGDVVGLSTRITFVSLVFWAWVLGPLGALLAIPLSLLLRSLLVDVDPASQWARPLISGAGNPSQRRRLTRHV